MSTPHRATGTLFIVATPIGNLEDITLRALRVLREVAVIAAEDTRRTGHLLARHAITTPTTSLHEHNEQTKMAAMLARLEAGEDVALVSDAGTPTVSDPGSRLIREAIAARIKVEPIPGPSAVMAALVASGLPSESFCFMGFPPTKTRDRKTWFDRLASVRGTIVFFEAPHRIQATLTELKAVAGDCMVVLGRELTKIHEELVRGPISEVLNQPQGWRGEYTVVAEIGLLPNRDKPTEAALLVEFGEMTIRGGRSKRAAVAELARRHRLPPNEVYETLEKAKKSVV